MFWKKDSASRDPIPSHLSSSCSCTKELQQLPQAGSHLGYKQTFWCYETMRLLGAHPLWFWTDRRGCRLATSFFSFFFLDKLHSIHSSSYFLRSRTPINSLRILKSSIIKSSILGRRTRVTTSCSQIGISLAWRSCGNTEDHFFEEKFKDLSGPMTKCDQQDQTRFQQELCDENTKHSPLPIQQECFKPRLDLMWLQSTSVAGWLEGNQPIRGAKDCEEKG